MKQIKYRSSNRAEQRALSWINSFKSTSSDNDCNFFNGSFTIKRRADYMEAMPEISILLNDLKMDIFKYIGHSVLSPLDGRTLIDSDERNKRVFNLDNARTFNQEFLQNPVSTALSRFVIVGAKQNQSGKRFLAVTFDQKTSQMLNEERCRIFRSVGYEDAIRPVNPHLSLFATTNQVVAEQALEQARSLDLYGSTIELGAAVLRRVNFK